MRFDVSRPPEDNGSSGLRKARPAIAVPEIREPSK
jgi:hypothetical protein